MVDTSLGWKEVFPIRAETKEVVCFHLVNGILTRFGLPRSIQPDNGRAFIFKSLSYKGLKRTVVSPHFLPPLVLRKGRKG